MGYGGIFGGIDTLVWGKDADKVFGTKPAIPAIPTLEDAQKKATGANIATLPQAQQLGAAVNLFNQDQLTAMLEKAFPGASQKIQDTISSYLSGELPKGVLNNLRRSAAERGIQSGTPGSGFNLGRELGSQLGMSLQLTQQGIDSAARWLAQTPSFDVTSMFVTPTQRYNASMDSFQRDLLESKVAAAPDPAARGQFDSTMALIGMVLSAYGGGSGYQGTYNPQAAYGGGGGAQGPQSPNSFYFGGGGYGVGKQQGGQWFMGGNPGPG